jgi:hypothetical protein
MIRSLFGWSLAFVVVSLGACTTSETGSPGTAGKTGSAGVTGTAGTTGAAGTTSNPPSNGGTTGSAGMTGSAGTAGTTGTTGTAGTNGTAGATGTAGTNGTAGTTGTAGSGGTTGTAGATGTAGGGGTGKTPMCISNDVAGSTNRVKTNYSECDVEGQAIDFDVAAGYDAALYGGKVLKPGYDPAMTPVTISNAGKAFSGSAVQMCHPYCYQSNLTIGVDFVPGTDAGLLGEIFFDFPAAGLGLPIKNAAGRASLGWIYLDGPALPAGAKVTAQMELKSTDKGLLVAKEIKVITLGKWFEFRYFPIDSTFTAADLTNITTIGFKLTMATAGAAEWHGVIYADHFQLRM